MPDSNSMRRTPWGSWQVLAKGKGFQVKRLVVNPGHRLSLQFHYRRSEHWVVVSGTAKVIVGERTIRATPGRYLFIPKKAKHRLENVGRTRLIVIEVQRGNYLGEDDMVRLHDDYART